MTPVWGTQRENAVLKVLAVPKTLAQLTLKIQRSAPRNRTRAIIPTVKQKLTLLAIELSKLSFKFVFSF